MPAKTCIKCLATKPISEFYIWKGKSRGMCKSCFKIDTANRDRRKREHDMSARAKSIMRQLRTRAKNRDLQLCVSVEWIERKLRQGFCEVTGLAFDFSIMGKSGPFAPTIDRINPALGYVEPNLQMVCWLYNRAKGKDDHNVVMILAESLMNASEDTKTG